MLSRERARVSRIAVGSGAGLGFRGLGAALALPFLLGSWFALDFLFGIMIIVVNGFDNGWDVQQSSALLELQYVVILNGWTCLELRRHSVCYMFSSSW